MAARDFFSLLGVEQRYDLDIDTLEANYRERSKEVHPDRHIGSEAAERVAALGASMELNQAIKTLKSPAKRAEYLLSLHGLEIGDNERLDTGLVMEILEAREELAEAQAEGNQGLLEELEERMLDRRDEILEGIAGAFAELAETGVALSAESLTPIKKQLILLRYVERYLEQFEEQDEAA